MEGSTLRIVFLGLPGAGKGTQARRMAEKHGIPQISTGEMLRAAITEDSSLGRAAKSYMDRGELVPDDVMIGLIRERLTAGKDTQRGFILDGFPRTLDQAAALDSMLEELRQPLTVVVDFRVPREVVLRRLTGRLMCRGCAASFHPLSAPPAVAGVCDQCQGELIEREDDNVETVSRRLEVHEAQTTPIAGYYRTRGLLREVEGARSIEEIEEQLANVVASRPVA